MRHHKLSPLHEPDPKALCERHVTVEDRMDKEKEIEAVAVISIVGFVDILLTMKNHMEKKTDHDMETGMSLSATVSISFSIFSI